MLPLGIEEETEAYGEGRGCPPVVEGTGRVCASCQAGSSLTHLIMPHQPVVGSLGPLPLMEGREPPG